MIAALIPVERLYCRSRRWSRELGLKVTHEFIASAKG